MGSRHVPRPAVHVDESAICTGLANVVRVFISETAVLAVLAVYIVVEDVTRLTHVVRRAAADVTATATRAVPRVAVSSGERAMTAAADVAPTAV